MIKDRNIDYKLKKEYWPVATFSCFAGAGGATVDAINGRALTEMSSLGVVGLKQTTTGDTVRHLLPMPGHWDTGNDIHVRVIWAEEGSSAGEITYKIEYKGLSFGAAPTAVGDAGLQGLDKVLVADPHCGVAEGVNATKWGTVNADSLNADYLIVDVEMAAESAGGLSAVLLGIEWAYLPKLTPGAQETTQADPTDA